MKKVVFFAVLFLFASCQREAVQTLKPTPEQLTPKNVHYPVIVPWSYTFICINEKGVQTNLWMKDTVLLKFWHERCQSFDNRKEGFEFIDQLLNSKLVERAWVDTVVFELNPEYIGKEFMSLQKDGEYVKLINPYKGVK